MIRRAAIILGLASLVGCGHSKDIHPVAAWNSSLESELTHSFENKKFVLGHTFNIGPRLNDFSANLADPRPFDAFVVTDADGLVSELLERRRLARGRRTDFDIYRTVLVTTGKQRCRHKANDVFG